MSKCNYCEIVSDSNITCPKCNTNICINCLRINTIHNDGQYACPICNYDLHNYILDIDHSKSKDNITTVDINRANNLSESEDDKMIRLDVKNCPICRRFLYKDGGLDYIYCYGCNNVFDWDTLKINKLYTNAFKYNTLSEEYISLLKQYNRLIHKK